jgi:hypothetical protein
MDHAEPPDVAPEVMAVERVVRDEGRLLLLFSWDAGASASGADESGVGVSGARGGSA